MKFRNYRGSSPYGNFITENFITVIFQNISEIFGLCVFWDNYFITKIFMLKVKYRKKCSNDIISLKKALAKYLANANLPRTKSCTRQVPSIFCNFWKSLAALWKPNLYRKHTQSSLFTSKNNVLMPAIKEKSPIIYASLTFIFTKKKKSSFITWLLLMNSAFLRTQN